MTGPLDVTGMLGPERESLLGLLRGLPADAWDRPTECPEWTVQGIALHVLGDDLSLLARQRDGATNGLVLYALDHPGVQFRALLDGFNEQWVRAASFLGTELVIDLLELAGAWSDSFYREVGLETVSGEPVGLFADAEPSPYWKVIAREYVERVVHQSQIRRAVGAPELDGRVASEAARVSAHLLAAWLGEHRAEEGTAIAISFGDLGTWSWVRDGDRWRVDEGASGVPEATVSIAAGAAIRALTRGISAAELDRMVTVDGDVALARGALDLAAPLLARPQP